MLAYFGLLWFALVWRLFDVCRCSGSRNRRYFNGFGLTRHPAARDVAAADIAAADVAAADVAAADVAAADVAAAASFTLSQRC